MRKVLHLRNQWARLAGVPVIDQTTLEQNIKQNIAASKTSANCRSASRRAAA
jgi:hypothetical protein